MGKYDTWTLVQLKNELRKRAKKLSGTKSELKTRLEYYDGNDQCVETTGEYHMKVPPESTFRDLHGGMDIPDVSMGRITAYLHTCQQKFNDKCVEMYLDRALHYVRLSSDVSDHSDHPEAQVFILSKMWAEMKKHTTYTMNVLLSKDGVVLEAECECKVGEGPSAHCKHIQTLLYGLHSFLDQEEILTRLSCTQTLQSFHRPAKTWVGSPLKATSMAEVRGKSCRFDPRPSKFQSGAFSYRDFFRNACINFQAQYEINMPVLQLFPPANLQAAHDDHDYLSETLPNQFLRKELRVTEISSKEVEELEKSTREQATSGVWREQRQIRLTSSRFGDIAKATVRRDKSKLAVELADRKSVHGPQLNWGITHEAVATEAFVNRTGLNVTKSGLCVARTMPFLAASPDGLVGHDAVLEIKCPYTIRNKKITTDELPYLVDVDGGLQLKKSHNYHYQV